MTTVKYRTHAYTPERYNWPQVLGPRVVGVPGLPGDQGITGPVGAVAPLSRGSRNVIINGDFSVNQRGYLSTTNGGYCHDRWLLAPYDGTITYMATPAALGELPESARSYASIQTTGATLAAGYTQWVNRLEGVKTLSGKWVTLSFWAKGAVDRLNVGFHFTQVFGTGGSPSASVRTALPMVTIGTTWARYSMTGFLPSITGLTTGTAGNDYVNCVFWTSAGRDQPLPGPVGIQNSTIHIWGVQLEEGQVATTFEQKPYAMELRACQRYYQKWQQPPLKGVTGSTTVGRLGMMLPVPMRAAPTLTITGTLNVYDGAAAGNFTTLGGVYNTPYMIEFDGNVSITWPAGSRTASVYQNGTGYLELNAEL